jgi:hypothetical protein
MNVINAFLSESDSYSENERFFLNYFYIGGYQRESGNGIFPLKPTLLLKTTVYYTYTPFYDTK